MTQKTLLVVGAGGDVGQGIVAAALQSGRRVVACGRNAAALDRLGSHHRTERLASVSGSIGSEAEAVDLWGRACEPFGPVGDVVISVSSGGPLQPILEWSAAGLNESLAGNLLTHFIAAKTFIPRLPADGMLLGVGGGTADFIFPNMAHFSIAQAGLRMLYRAVGKECREGPQVRELMIIAMVNGESSRDRAGSDWLTDEEVGRHVCAILDAPERFPETILKLTSRDQVGSPDTKA
jgi:NAD(P)-dependent dehydrogenase (short-subunit alcohol dehydrogenase family)